MRPENSPSYPILELQKKRWSPRAFDPNRSIDSATMCSLLEAARWSPSCFNDQPWTFLLANKDQAGEFQTMLGCLTEKNQSWAKNASVLLIAIGSNVFAHNAKANMHGKYDTGAAVANLTFEATSKGIYVHQMAGFDSEKTRTTYSIPPTADPIAAIALGYLGDPESLPPDFRDMEEKPRPRKPLNDFVFSGKWGRSAGIAK